jgi:uncharacterized protein (DUF427 family)
MRNNIDHWYEEDEEVFVHPRDPYHRVDILQSSRRVKVRVNGEVVTTRCPYKGVVLVGGGRGR